MKPMKKVLSCALALTIATSMFAMPAYAQDDDAQAVAVETADLPEEEPERDAAEADANGFIIENGVLKGYKGEDGDIVIPSTVKQIDVAAFKNNKSITSVVMPDSVLVLSDEAFYGCVGLSSVTFSANLQKIMGRVFKGCTSLKSIDIPDSVTYIGSEAFTNLNLLNVTLGKGLKTIEEKAFCNCPFKSIDFPEGLTTIGAWAFIGCNRLEAIVLPDSLTKLSGNAFTSCSSVKSITFGKGLDSIPNTTFPYCTSLEKLVIPDNIKTIGYDSFKGCTALKEIDFGKVVVYNGGFKDCSGLTEFMLPDTVTEFGYYNDLFAGMTGVTEFRIPPRITDLSRTESGRGHGLQSAFPNLKTLHLDKNLMYLGTNDFKSCTYLTDIYYTGTKSDWLDTFCDFNKDTYLVKNMDFYDIHCADGTIEGSKVIKPTLSSIKVTAPTKTTYNIGEPLDVTGGMVTLTYSDKTTKEMPLTADMCTGFDSSKAGTKTITVTYEGKTTTFKVTIKKGETPVDPTQSGVTLNGEPVASYEAAINAIGKNPGDFTITISKPVTVAKFAFPKNAKLTIIATDNGGITTAATSLAPTAALTLECPITNSKGKDIKINAKSDLTLIGGTFGNVSVGGKAALTDVTINGNLALKAKADKSGLTTDTLENVTVAKKITSNNNVSFVNCKSIGTVAVKGLVTITGDGTKAVAVTSGAKTGVCTIEGLVVEKKLSVAADLSAYDLTANNAVDVKGNAVIEQSTIVGKLTVAKNLTAEGISVNGAVDVKGNAVIDFSTIIGKLNVKGILTVNSDVRVENAVTCAELNSTKGAELTAMSFAVTKNGVSVDSGEITLKLIDKNGTAVSPKPDKKGVITVSKKFKDSKTKAKEFDVPTLKFNNNGTICPLKCVNGKLVVSA